jgi:hypothetical protein
MKANGRLIWYGQLQDVLNEADTRCTQSIGSPAGFMIVALNGRWVCKNCLDMVESNERSSSAKLPCQLT